MILIATVVLLIIGYFTSRLIDHGKYVIAGVLVGVTMLFSIFAQVGVDYVVKHRIGFCGGYYNRY